MRKALLVVVASVVSAISCVFVLPPADAQAGGTPPIGVSTSQTIPAGGVFGECAFPVLFQQVGKAGTITLPSDRFILKEGGGAS